jgi:hypothetical protein
MIAQTDQRRLVSRLRAISWIAVLGLMPVVFYYTSRGTWDPRDQNVSGGWSAFFFTAQAEAMLVHARLDVNRADIQGECFLRDSLCFGYFGITPSLVRIPFLGISRYLHSALTPIYLAVAVLLAYWAALQLMQRSLRESSDSARSHPRALWYFIIGAVALGPGGTLMFVTRPAVYEEAIAWSVAFILLAMDHVWAWHSGERRSLVPAVLFAIAAANARPTAAVTSGVLGLVVIAMWALSGSRDSEGAVRDLDTAKECGPGQAVPPLHTSRRVLVWALCLGLLPGLTAAGVFWLKVRTPVPNPLINEQFQLAPHWKVVRQRNGNRTSGLMFTPTELVAYFRPDTVIRRNDEGPFFDFRFPEEPILWVPPLPAGGAYVERFASLTATMPLPWIVNLLVAVWLGVAAWRLGIPGLRDAPSSRAPTMTRTQWILSAGLLVSAAAMAVLVVMTAGITNRYLSDFFATSVVGAALGHRVIFPLLDRRPIVGAGLALVAVLLVSWSVIVTLSLTTRLVWW